MVISDGIVLRRNRNTLSWRLTAIALVFAALLALSGCWVYSVNPLYEEGRSQPDPDLVLDQSLIGSWGHMDDNCLWILTVGGEGSAYGMTMAPSSGCKSDEKTSKYEGHLVKLGSHQFLDVNARSGEVCDLCLPLHSIFLVSRENGDLALIPVDLSWMSRAINEKKVVLAHLPSQDSSGRSSEVVKASDAVVLTASSQELKEFVRKYADDKAAFKPDSDAILKFKRR